MIPKPPPRPPIDSDPGTFIRTPWPDRARFASIDRLAAYAFVGIVVGALVVLLHRDQIGSMTADVQSRLAISEALVSQLLQEKSLLEAENRTYRIQIEHLMSIAPTERVVMARACTERRPVPTFSRESQFVGVSRP